MQNAARILRHSWGLRWKTSFRCRATRRCRRWGRNRSRGVRIDIRGGQRYGDQGIRPRASDTASRIRRTQRIGRATVHAGERRMASALELYGRHVERGEETGGRDVGGTVAVDGVMTCRKLYLVASRKHCGRVVRIGKIGQSEMVDLLPASRIRWMNSFAERMSSRALR